MVPVKLSYKRIAGPHNSYTYYPTTQMHWLTVLLFSSLRGMKLHFIVLCFLNYHRDCQFCHIFVSRKLRGSSMRCPWPISPLEPRWSSQVCVRQEATREPVLLSIRTTGRLLSSLQIQGVLLLKCGFLASLKSSRHGEHTAHCLGEQPGSRSTAAPYRGHGARLPSPLPGPRPRVTAADLPAPITESLQAPCFMMMITWLTPLFLIFWLLLPSNL